MEIQACDLKFFLDNQNSDHAWIKGGGWKLLNVETIEEKSYVTSRQIVWLTRTVEIEPQSIKVISDD